MSALWMRYEPHEVEYVRKAWAEGKTFEQIGADIGRSWRSVKALRDRLKLPARRLGDSPKKSLVTRGLAYTDEQNRWLAERWKAGISLRGIETGFKALFGVHRNTRRLYDQIRRISEEYGLEARFGHVVQQPAPEVVERLRFSGHIVAPAPGDMWLFDREELFSLAQLEARWAFMQRRAAA